MPLVASQIFRGLSWLPLTMYFPSGDHETEFTLLECPERVYSFLPLAASQIFRVLSRLPLAMYFLSGDHETEFTKVKCPERVRSSLPLVASQIFRVPSQLPLAMCLPSGDHETDFTKLKCPERVRTSLPLEASQIFTKLSSLPLAMYFPSGDHATEFTLPECPSWNRISGSGRSAPSFIVSIFSATMPRAVSCARQSVVAQNTAQKNTVRIIGVLKMASIFLIVNSLWQFVCGGVIPWDAMILRLRKNTLKWDGFPYHNSFLCRNNRRGHFFGHRQSASMFVSAFVGIFDRHPA